MPPPRILILGGGYVAITVARTLRPAIRRGELSATIVSRENFHAFHGFVGEMVTGRIGPGNMLSPARRIFPPAAVHVAEIESIDLEARRVVTSRHLDGARSELTYDHLVLALGTTENLEVYPGLAEHAFKLKAFADCLRLRNHLLEMFELAEIERDPDERRRLLTFVVAGGGYAGTELAGELADFARLLTAREFSRLSRTDWRVVLVHPGRTIMPELHGTSSFEKGARAHPKLVEYATAHARSLGVELLTEARSRARRRTRSSSRTACTSRHARSSLRSAPGRSRSSTASSCRGMSAAASSPTATSASRATRTSGPAATAPRCRTRTAAPARRSGSTR